MSALDPGIFKALKAVQPVIDKELWIVKKHGSFSFSLDMLIKVNRVFCDCNKGVEYTKQLQYFFLEKIARVYSVSTIIATVDEKGFQTLVFFRENINDEETRQWSKILIAEV